MLYGKTFLDGAPGSIEDIRRFKFFESLSAQIPSAEARKPVNG